MPVRLPFYGAASKEGVTAEQRWALWRSMYDFAAVPPGPDGEAMARTLLDHAWPEYPSVLDRIRTQPAVLVDQAHQDVDRIGALLQLDRPVEIQLVLYVGALETNAFTYVPDDGRPHVALPVEGRPGQATLLAAHELTHAIHLPLARLPGGWERSIAQTILTEGLAMHVVKALYPGRPDAAYTEATPGWYGEASARRDAILRGIRPFLAAKDGATVGRFTMGKGSTGLEREAYYAGWLVVDRLLRNGESFAQIARVPEQQLVGVVGAAIDAVAGR